MRDHIEILSKIKPFKKKIIISSDKSISIRSVLLASQAIGKSRLYNLLESEDVMNTLRSISKLGIKYKKLKNCYLINGYGLNGFETERKVTIDAGNSGTLARLILGLLVNVKKLITLKGDGSLSKRDFSRVTNPLKNFGANISSKKNSLPVKILGSEFLRPIDYIEDLGSAQCKSSVMLAAIKTPGITKIKANGVSTFRDLGELNKKESPRLDLALKFLNMIGIKTLRNKNDVKIYGNPNLKLKGNYIVKEFMKDHRIFMMTCVAALTFGGKWKIYDKKSIKTSFPEFLVKIKELGAKII